MNSESSRTVILSIASSRSSWVRTAMSYLLRRLPVSTPADGSVVRCVLPGRRSGGRRLLVADLGQHGPEVADVRREEPGQGRHGRLHAAAEPREKDLARRQAG